MNPRLPKSQKELCFVAQRIITWVDFSSKPSKPWNKWVTGMGGCCAHHGLITCWISPLNWLTCGWNFTVKANESTVGLIQPPFMLIPQWWRSLRHHRQKITLLWGRWWIKGWTFWFYIWDLMEDSLGSWCTRTCLTAMLVKWQPEGTMLDHRQKYVVFASPWSENVGAAKFLFTSSCSFAKLKSTSGQLLHTFISVTSSIQYSIHPGSVVHLDDFSWLNDVFLKNVLYMCCLFSLVWCDRCV